MARYLFSSDLFLTAPVPADVRLASDAPFTLWTERSGGVQITDCTAPDGVTPLTTDNLGNFLADGSGQRPAMRGPDGVVLMWVDTGSGVRYAIAAADLTRDVLTAAIGWLAGVGVGGVTDHGALSGLLDDDHPQYHTDARGDSRYFTQAQVTAAIISAVTSSSLADRSRANHSGTQLSSSISDFAAAVQAVGGGTGGTGVTDHGALSGLLDDDHPQYHTDTRGDARYYLKAAVDQAITSAVSTSSTGDRSRANHTGTQLSSSISDFATAVQAFVTNRLRFDAAQTLTSSQQAQGKANLGLSGFTIAAARTATDPVLSDADALALYGEGAFFTVDPA